MHRIAFAFATAVALLATTAVQASDKPTGEERLAKLLEGRKAEEPVDCIPLTVSRDATIIDKTAIVYGFGSLIYVNRPKHADQLDNDLIMVTEPKTGQLCKIDVVKLHDHSGNWFRGFVTLEQFVPYRRVDKAE